MNLLLTVLFFCSGATALIYEVVWSKYLALMFGSTVQAQTVVLAVFMGGLALGNRLFGRFADRVQSPVRAYGIIELAVGLFALLFHFLYGAADKLFVQLGTGLLESSASLLLLKASLSVALLLVPTILMGGTLPLIAAWLQNRAKEAGRSSARFYAINTLGAVAGAGCAGFVLVRQFGLATTLQMTGLLNLAIGVAAITLAGSATEAKTQPLATTDSTVQPTSVPPSRWHGFDQAGFACLLVFLTGAISMSLEILAARSLSMVFGASLQAFSVMLMAFILGIGGGGLWVSSLRKPAFLSEKIVVTLLLSAAVLIAVFLGSIERCALLYLKLRHAKGALDPFLHHQLVSTIISIAVIGLPAALIGAVLPLCIRISGKTSSGLGEQVGRLLTWNTLGAVLGAVVTGFVLMPLLGLRLSLGLVGAALGLTALLIAWRNAQPNGMCVATVVAALVVLVSFTGQQAWQYTLSSGIFRLGADEVTPDVFSKIRQRDRLLFYKDGTDATVAVITDRKPQKFSEHILSINGKPDGSTLGDLSTEYLLGHLPLLARPESKDVFVLGLGTGITSGALLGHPIDSLTIAENCGPVIEAANLFEPWNRGVLTNRLTQLFREDARTVLKLSSKQYDVIISEPSNPWTAGIGSVFSREFYELAASRMKDGGIMAQWFHVYEMNDDIVGLVLRTFQSVFPHFEIWETRNGDLILLGSKQSWECSPNVFRQVFARPAPKRDLELIDLRSPEAVIARQVASQRTALAILETGPLQSDFFPVLEYEAPKAFYQGGAAYKLFLFDERTLQAPFAPEEKRKTLSNLKDEWMVGVFENYGSANSPLMQYISWRAQILGMSRAADIYRPAPFFDLIFRLPASYPKQAEILEDASPTMAELQQAEAMVYQPETRRQAAEKIESLLRDWRDDLFLDGKKNPRLEWFAAVAAKAHFLEKNPEAALRCVALGLRHKPEDPQLLYIQRLLKTHSPSPQPSESTS